MASNDVKLLGSWASPYVFRAKIALNIKKVAYEYFEEVHSNKSELLLKYNPIYKKVPVLIHNNKSICESMIVVQYIDEVFEGPSLLPSDPLERSGARFWAYYIDDKVPVLVHKDKPISESMIIVQYIDEVWEGTAILPSDPLERAQAKFWAYYIDDKLYTSYIRIIAKKTTEEAKVQGVEETVSCLKLLEDHLEERPFFGGEEIGYVDIALGSRIGWFKVVEEVENVKLLDEERLPNLVKWAARFLLDDRVKGVMPEHNKLVEYCMVLQETVWKSKPAN